MTRALRILVLTVLALCPALLAGCATADPDAESDIPWNVPQRWEGAPGIPGLESR